MHPILDALRKLHELDIKIIRRKRIRETIPASLKRIDDEIHRKQNAADAAEEKLSRTRAGSERLDLEIRSIDETIKKYETQVAQASSNKEYNAFLSEIASKKADLSRIEDKALDALSTIDELVEQAHNAKDELEKAKKSRDKEAATVKRSIEEIDAELAQLTKQRPALAEKVDRGLLTQYERIVAKRGESALVPVVDKACQGCFMSVSAEVYNALNRGKDVIMCKNCSRILYLP